MDLSQIFVDLSKAFITVNCAGLWKILSKLGCFPLLSQDSKVLP